jgi:hypothetical protein
MGWNWEGAGVILLLYHIIIQASQNRREYLKKILVEFIGQKDPILAMLE